MNITWEEFSKIDIRVGTIEKAESFKEARNPSYKLWINFGEEIGTLKSSAQITDLYSVEKLEDKQVLAVVNFPKKQIANFMSECLVLGAVKDFKEVVLIQPEQKVKNGLRIA